MKFGRGAVDFAARLKHVSAVLSWTVAIATIFPPGALVVHSRPSYTVRNTKIPIYDSAYRGVGNMHDLQANALFGMDSVGKY